MNENKPKRKRRNQNNTTEENQKQAASKIPEQNSPETDDEKDIFLSPEKKKTVLKTIEIRLDGIGEATKRTRLTFIISIIASLAILVTLWNTYFSWTSRFAFDSNLKFEAKKIPDIKSLTNQMGSGDFPLPKWLFDKLDPNTQNAIKQLKEKNNIEEKDYEEIEKGILTKINKLLEDESLYQDIKNPYCKSLNAYINDLQESEIKEGYKSNKIRTYKRAKEKRCDDKNEKSDEDRELEEILTSDDDRFDNRTNLINKFLLERSFEIQGMQVNWEIVSVSNNTPLPTYENNRRIAATEWIKNQNVLISFLGVSINASEFSFLGSLSIAIISFWLFFSFRRENRAIVSLLRDVRKDIHRPSKKQEIGDDNWDIANLAFQGVVQKFIFAHTGKTDLPMSSYEIFGESSEEKNGDILNGLNELTNYIVSKITKIVRVLSLTLLFLPVFTIFITIYVDINTTYNLSPFSPNPFRGVILRRTGMNSIEQIAIENYLAFILGIITFLICSACLIFQFRTTRALRDFDARLNPDDEKIIEKTKRSIIDLFEKGYASQVRNPAK